MTRATFPVKTRERLVCARVRRRHRRVLISLPVEYAEAGSECWDQLRDTVVRLVAHTGGLKP